jgi:hypothetical protein
MSTKPEPEDLSAPMDFDSLEPALVHVKIRGKEYQLREAGVDTVMKWRNAMYKATRPDTDGTPRPSEGFPDTDVLLLSECLYDVKTAKPVDRSFIRSLSMKVFNPLLTRLRQISGLDTVPSPAKPDDSSDSDKQGGTGGTEGKDQTPTT